MGMKFVYLCLDSHKRFLDVFRRITISLDTFPGALYLIAI